MLELRRIRLPRPPLVSVLQITYTDTNGVLQTLDPSIYLVSNLREPGTIEPVYGQVWPVARYQADSVQVQFTGGYVTTLAGGPISMGTSIVIPPLFMAGIYAYGQVLTIDQGAAQENVLVTAITSISFTAAFANVHADGCKITNVPARIQAGLKLMVGHWYTHREEVQDGARPNEVPQAAKMLLAGCDYGAYP